MLQWGELLQLCLDFALAPRPYLLVEAETNEPDILDISSMVEGRLVPEDALMTSVPVGREAPSFLIRRGLPRASWEEDGRRDEDGPRG